MKSRKLRRDIAQKIKAKLNKRIEKTVASTNSSYERIRNMYYRNEGKPAKRVYKCCSTNCEWCRENLTIQITRERLRGNQEFQDWQQGELDVRD